MILFLLISNEYIDLFCLGVTFFLLVSSNVRVAIIISVLFLLEFLQHL